MKNKIVAFLLFLIYLFVFGAMGFDHPFKARPIDIAVNQSGQIFVLKGDSIFKYDKRGVFIGKINKKVTYLNIDLKDNHAYRQEVELKNERVIIKNHLLTNTEILEYANYFGIAPELKQLVKKVFYPNSIVLNAKGGICAVGKDYFSNPTFAVIDPNDGHTIAIHKVLSSVEAAQAYPTGIDVDKQGNVYIVDYGTKYVYKYGIAGQLLGKWGGEGDRKGKFKEPWGIGIDRRDGSVYVSDIFWGRKDKPREYPQRRIQKFNQDGKYKLKWGKNKIVGINWLFFRWEAESELGDVVDIAIDHKGDVYLLEKNRHRVSKYTNQGKLIKKWGRAGDKPGEFKNPEGICVDKDNNVYVADTDNNRIQKFDSNGKFLMEIK